MLTETQFNALGERLKTVTKNRKGDKVERAYLSMDYAFYCKTIEKNEGKEPGDVIYADYAKPQKQDVCLANDKKKVAYYPCGKIYEEIEHDLDLIFEGDQNDRF